MSDNEGYVPLQEGLRLYYRMVGDGPGTVVIPAATGLAADLESLARGRRVIFYDQRCRGQSDVDPDESQELRGLVKSEIFCSKTAHMQAITPENPMFWPF